MSRIVLFSDVYVNITGLRAVFEQINKYDDITDIIGWATFSASAQAQMRLWNSAWRIM